MPTYEVELSDGRIVDVEGDKEPTESDVMGLLSPKAPVPQLPPPGQRPFPENPDLNEPSSGFEPSSYIPPGEKPPSLFQSFVPLPEPFQGKSLLGQASAAGANFGIQTAGGMASPGGLMALPLGLLGKVGAVAAGAGFGVPAVKQGLERVYQGAALEQPQEVMEGGLQALTGGLITIGAAKALPRAAAELTKTLKGSPDASQVSPTTEVHGDVRPLEEPTQVVPTQEGGGGVQPQAQETQVGVTPEVPLEKAVPSAVTGEPNASEARQSGAVEPPVVAGGTPQAMAEGGTPAETPQGGNVTPPVTEPPKGIAASVRNKWTSATEPLGGEGGFISLDPIRDLVDKATPYVKSAVQFVKDVGEEESSLSKLGDYGKSVLNWSAKLQKSFGEAGAAQKEIAQKVPDALKREGITNWIQANGDANVLRTRALSTHDPKLRAGYEAALNLTPDEIAVANDVKAAYDTLGKRGQSYDVLKNFKDNYVTQIWDLGKGPTMAGARTLRDKFRFSKASTFPTFFDGEQAGYTPKTKDISKLLPVYLHEMNSVIAARQLVEQMSKGTASDGRPLVSPRGSGMQVDGPQGKATLITPKSINGDTLDYKTIPNQPALNDWTWSTKDTSGKPIFMKSDLALHPEAYDRLKNVLGKSAIREWYSTRTSALAQVPKLLVKGLDMANSETKRTMLGLLAPFHQVQEGTHGIGHRVNPTFNIPKVDLVNNAAQMDAAQHGLMLHPDRVSAEQFMEGFRTSGLVSKIPYIGALADHYSNYLFHDYIPGLKYKTYDAILQRNQKVYAKELASGSVGIADVKHLSAEQANAAYGHLNYADMARNPTIQHIAQLGLLAPDFFEARARFAGQSIKGISGAKVGREQILALSTLAIAQAATAFTAAHLAGGTWDPKRPFEFHTATRRYSMRSVPEDISSLIHDTRSFIYSRISPLLGKGIVQYLSGVDYRGQKISAGETTKELAQQPIPISVKGFMGLGRQSLSGLEQLASAVGLRISRYSPTTDVFDLAHDWMKSSADSKTQKRLEIQQHSVFPDSEYKPLRNALADDNTNAAKDAYKELLKTKTPQQVRTTLSHPHPFTGSAADEAKFVKSLTPDQKKLYNEAVQERKNTLKKFIKLTGTSESIYK